MRQSRVAGTMNVKELLLIVLIIWILAILAATLYVAQTSYKLVLVPSDTGTRKLLYICATL
jgi:hypothetical protein